MLNKDHPQLRQPTRISLMRMGTPRSNLLDFGCTGLRVMSSSKWWTVNFPNTAGCLPRELTPPPPANRTQSCPGIPAVESHPSQPHHRMLIWIHLNQLEHLIPLPMTGLGSSTLQNCSQGELAQNNLLEKLGMVFSALK